MAEPSPLLRSGARAMRRILVDHARARGAASAEAWRLEVTLHRRDRLPAGPPALDILALDSALDRLASLDERQARLVELRVFSGLTIEESAQVLSCSHATVSRDWKHAQAWLRREMAARVPRSAS